MTNLFDNTGLPLWVYIVIIVVGSVLLLVVLAILLRWWYVRQRAKRPQYDGLTGASRRMTVRRGRMVPTSQHLSLTGSKFGMRQFGQLADNDSAITGRRSPFEWWMNMLDRSQSRQDNMSQIEAGSIFTRPSSRATSVATRKEFRTVTPTRTPEKNKEPTTRTTELTIPSPSPSPTPSTLRPTVNFSRSFVPKGPSSPLAPRSQYTLSRIEESSPHHSLIGTAAKQLERSSYFAATPPFDHTSFPGQMVGPRSSPTTLRRSMTLSVPFSSTTSPKLPPAPPQDQPSPTFPFPASSNLRPGRFSMATSSNRRKTEDLGGTSPDPPRPKTADAATDSYRYRAQFSSQNFSVPSLPTSLALPSPVARASSRQYDAPSSSSAYHLRNQSQPDLSKRLSTVSKHDSTRTSISLSASRKSSTSIGPSGIFYDSQVPNYWSSRTDLQDLSSTLGVNGANNSIAGNNTKRSRADANKEGERESIIGVITVPGKHNSRVLRKKSLSRMKKDSPINGLDHRV